MIFLRFVWFVLCVYVCVFGVCVCVFGVYVLYMCAFGLYVLYMCACYVYCCVCVCCMCCCMCVYVCLLYVYMFLLCIFVVYITGYFHITAPCTLSKSPHVLYLHVSFISLQNSTWSVLHSNSLFFFFFNQWLYTFLIALMKLYDQCTSENEVLFGLTVPEERESSMVRKHCGRNRKLGACAS